MDLGNDLYGVDSMRLNKKAYIGVSFAFASYLSFLIYKVFIKAYGNYYRVATDTPDYNLELFKSIERFTRAYNNYSFEVYFYNIYGNILAFMPAGLLLPMIFPKLKCWWNVLLGFLLSLAIECGQYITCLGTFDVDDLMLNTIGVFIGVVIYQILVQIVHRSEKLKKKLLI